MEKMITRDMIRMGENSTLEFKTEDARNDGLAKEIDDIFMDNREPRL